MKLFVLLCLFLMCCTKYNVLSLSISPRQGMGQNRIRATNKTVQGIKNSAEPRWGIIRGSVHNSGDNLTLHGQRPQYKKGMRLHSLS